MIKDIINKKEVSELLMHTIKTFLAGEVVKIGHDEYRYAEKDQPLYEVQEDNGDTTCYVATETAIYKRYNSESNGKYCFRWIGVGDILTVIKSLEKEIKADMSKNKQENA